VSAADRQGAGVGGLTVEEHRRALLQVVEVEARHLCEATREATEGGVPDALLLPALVSVFREAGMIPADLDLGMLLGMFR
jgi:hypothetical protein